MPDPATAWPMSPKEAAERKANDGYTLEETMEIASDPAKWARLFGFVEHEETREALKFEPSSLQIRMFAHYRLCQERWVPCRMVVPKTRRGGGSTGAQAILYVHCHNYKARVATIGTYEKVSMNLFGMARFFNDHDRFKSWPRAKKILETGEIKWPNGSVWEKYTADNPEGSRSTGLQAYHASEVGRWQDGGACDAGETLQSMQGSVPREGFTVIIEESTAQGAQGAFYKRFLSARWPTADELGVAEGREYWRQWQDETPQNLEPSTAGHLLQFVRFFAGWYELEKNAQTATPDDIAWVRGTLDPAEVRLMERYRTIGPQGPRLGHIVTKATLWEQLVWRRAVIKSEFDGDVDGFAQEYPSSPAEAFASSGRHTFNILGCAWMLEQSRNMAKNQRGNLTRQPDGGVTFSLSDAGMFILHEDRAELHRYLCALDTCGGRSNQRNSEAADYNAGLTMRSAYVDPATGIKHPCAVVMTLAPRNQIDPDILAEQMKLMSDYYGGCLVVFEVNNTGAAFRQEAVALGMNLYREVVTDKATSQQTEYLGWTTTKESRAQLIGTLKRHIRCNGDPNTREDGVLVYSPTIAAECANMIVGQDGKDQAPPSKHDDHVLALGMALQCINGATLLAPKKRKRQDPPDLKSWRMGAKAMAIRR